MLTITPKLISTSTSGSKVSVSVGVSPSVLPGASGFSTLLVDLRWNTAMATIDPASIKVIGNSALSDVTTMDAKGVANGILRFGGWSGTGSFSGDSTLVTFEYTQSTLAPVNFVVTEERFDNVSYLQAQPNTNVLQVAMNATGQSITPPIYETDPPVVSTYSPEFSSKTATVDGNLVLTFNETVTKGTGNIELRLGSATGTLVESFNIASSSKVTLNGNELSINPTVNLLNNTNYVVLVPTGVVRDLSGNAYVSGNPYEFTTIAPVPVDKTPPTFVSANTPSSSATVAVTDLGMNLVATFSEAVTPRTGTIDLRMGSATGTLVESFNVASSSKLSFSGATVSIDPTANLAQGKTYFVVFAAGSVKDAANNALASSANFSFSTATAPVLLDAALNPSLVAVPDANKLSIAQLQTHLSNLVDVSAVSQYKLLDSLVLKLEQNNALSPTGVLSSTKILPSGNSTTSGLVADKALGLSLSLPANMSLESAGPSSVVNAAQSKTFFTNVLEQSFPSSQASSALAAYKTAVAAGLDTLASYTVSGSSASSLSTASAAAKAATSYAARLLTPAGDSRGESLQLTGVATVNDLSVLNLLNLSNDATVQVSNISNLLVAGPGSVSVSGTSACVLVGDTFNQTLTGGPGNDVLGGGGGNDVLYGGAGKDTFLLGGTGRVTIGDFAAGDVMKFNIPGVTSLATLLPRITSSKLDSQGVTYELDTGLSVCLVGKTLSTVFTADMFAFGA